VTAFAVFALAVLAGGWLAYRPLRNAARPWPADPPDDRDDVGRSVSSLRDLEFARAAGTIDPADHARLRAELERAAFVPRKAAPASGAPVRTFAIAALMAALAAVLIVAYLPREVGDRAPGTTVTGTVPRLAPTTQDLERRVAASPNDVPTLLALADSYRDDQRAGDAARTYQRVLSLDRDSVPALDGLALILFQSGERDGALVATDRALSLRPRDADALFLKGLILYQRADFKGAVDVWTVYLDVGEFHPAAPMVRSLYENVKAQLAAK